MSILTCTFTQDVEMLNRHSSKALKLLGVDASGMKSGNKLKPKATDDDDSSTSSLSKMNSTPESSNGSDASDSSAVTAQGSNPPPTAEGLKELKEHLDKLS